MQYVNLIIDNNSNHTDNLYTYRTDIPGLVPGDKVYVPFAMGNRRKAAYVYSVSDVPLKEIPEGKLKNLKLIEEKDPDVFLGQKAMLLAEWMKERYFCRFIEAITCFTPVGEPSKRGKVRNPYAELEGEEQEGSRRLTEEQGTALKCILPYIEKRKHQVVLIHGVTSSGKTELYMQVIAECLNKGRTALMLVPEISLTTQTIRRFLGRFGRENIAVLHSKLSRGERYDEWMRVRRGEVKIVIGARSAIFAPLDNIGTIILDEEHETTYKSDMTPKYETREVAEEMGKLHEAVVLLGSATPSLAAYRASEEGRYLKVVLNCRYNKTPLPRVEIVDMRKELKEGNKNIFSRSLYEKTGRCIEGGRQVILFLNRRGHSTFLSCRSCGYVMRCADCDISLTYHKAEKAAICHFCGKQEPAPKTCPSCGSPYIKYFGVGTEKVVETAEELFPGAVIDRLDMDTAQRKGSGDKILERFSKGKTQILVGTQLVAKGLDFANVGLVGVVSADISLNIPDFRSAERTFQLITQAAGRAGRGDRPGDVVIQTYSPEHYAILTAAEQNYQAFYDIESMVRKQIYYPPYSELIQVVLAAETEGEAASAAEKVKVSLLRRIGKDQAHLVLGPRPAPMLKAGGLYRYQMLIKTGPENRERYWTALNGIKQKIIREKEKEWTFSIDVNPYSYL